MARRTGAALCVKPASPSAPSSAPPARVCSPRRPSSASLGGGLGAPGGAARAAGLVHRGNQVGFQQCAWRGKRDLVRGLVFRAVVPPLLRCGELGLHVGRVRFASGLCKPRRLGRKDTRPTSTAASRLRKAVTSHRTPKRCRPVLMVCNRRPWASAVRGRWHGITRHAATASRRHGARLCLRPAAAGADAGAGCGWCCAHTRAPAEHDARYGARRVLAAFARRLVAVEVTGIWNLPVASGWRELGRPWREGARPTATAASRLWKAVTSHRTPKRCG